MGYKKTISYSNIVELYEYEKDPPRLEEASRRNRKRLSIKDTTENMGKNGKDMVLPREPSPKREDNARRSAMVFRRLISANLGECSKPLLISLTYAENIEDIGQGHKDFNNFARNVRAKFGGQVRYIAVPEFQQRGAIHFHALFWGLPSKKLARAERRTRLVASYWGLGYVDLIMTDGNHKIAGYLSKYMIKGIRDIRMSGRKGYFCSKNIIRPLVEKNALIEPLFFGGLKGVPDLSNAKVLVDKEYDTKHLGKGRFRKFEILDDFA